MTKIHSRQGEKQRLIWAYKILFLDVPLLSMPGKHRETSGKHWLTVFVGISVITKHEVDTCGWIKEGSSHDFLILFYSCCLWSWFWSMLCTVFLVSPWPGAVSTRRAQDHFHRCGSGALFERTEWMSMAVGWTRGQSHVRTSGIMYKLSWLWFGDITVRSKLKLLLLQIQVLKSSPYLKTHWRVKFLYIIISWYNVCNYILCLWSSPYFVDYICILYTYGLCIYIYIYGSFRKWRYPQSSSIFMGGFPYRPTSYGGVPLCSHGWNCCSNHLSMDCWENIEETMEIVPSKKRIFPHSPLN